jgi:hypothetical protein
MKAITSCKCRLKNRLTLSNVLEFFEICRTSNSFIHVYKNGEVCNETELARMVSFFLTIKERDQFLLVVEGDEAKESFHHIISFLKSSAIPLERV